ncbi:MAG TPA: DUF222 domain-containing protein [Xanthomonadales bacterium]|nr:DUF222 domain-containing protein [Xanthomonadales bacterium]
MLDHTNSSAPSTSDFVAQHLAASQNRQQHIRQLEDDLCELAAHIDAAMFRWLVLLREFDECQGWVGEGIKSCAHWLNWKCGLSLNAGRERLRVAQALPALPQTTVAFREGRLSYSKVRAISRVATTRNESVLLNIAFHGTTWHVEQAVSAWRREKRLEVLKRDNRRHELRELRCYYDDEGLMVLKGRFTPETGAIIQQALTAIMDQLQEERKNVSAETSVFEIPDPLKQHPQPTASRRADAMVRMAEAFLAGEFSGNSRDLYTINIHTDMETLKAHGQNAESQLENGKNVSAETSRRLCCDAGVVHWLEKKNHENGEIQPLSVGRKTRTVPPSIRRALQRRDRGCRFPGCSCRRFVDAHHIHHWADGGETSMENLVLLCRHHHRLVHEGGFGLRALPGGKFEFTNPDGKCIPDAPQTRFSGNAFELMARNSENNIVITPRTGIPNWDGGGMDVDIVVHGLQRLE